MLRQFVIVATLLLASANANSSEFHSSTIANVRVRSNVVYIRLASCTNYARIYISTEYDKAMVALALSAAATGARVQVDLEGSCQSTEPLINYIDANY